MPNKKTKNWDIQKSEDLYLINSWGSPYFSISESGEVVVSLEKSEEHPVTKGVSLMTIAKGLKERGFDLPALLRFEDLLESRIRLLNETFLKAMEKVDYKGTYRGVFPIKVNQQHQVIEDISEFGKKYHHGFEAGSKAELIIAMTYVSSSESLVICNGYKDSEFIDLALLSRSIGINTVLVIEMPQELDVIIERSKALGISPVLGLRVRLSAKAGGHWNSSGGDNSMFGLNSDEIMKVVDKLKGENMLDTLQLLHYHLGSQIPNIRDIRSGVIEASRYYCELKKEGANMLFLDIGGGLAVDYDGTHTNYGSSCNYGLNEYCADVVEGIMEVCDRAEIEHPTIISESGRATVSYYSVLLFNILDVERFNTKSDNDMLGDTTNEILENLFYTKNNLTTKNIQESFNDALYYRDTLKFVFNHGEITLREKALGERLFWSIMHKIEEFCEELEYVPDEIADFSANISDIYYGNFSVFQSLPDIWAIDQLFPVMPIHRLDEKPDRKGIIADMTCDCDGRINRFIGLEDVKNALELHQLRDNEEYVIGVFLVGAYQETLGDLHNLMGDTNVVSVKLTANGEYYLTKEVEGDTVADILEVVEYNTKSMVERMRKKAEEAVGSGTITAKQRKSFLELYQIGLRGYTYYENN
ncbi:MAG: biosynthetic arginine decarboxylase [Spirochaetales bacterium]|nr:biosynthetic arginine decarboxylase [Spirochaetales bacterium]